MRQPDCLLDVYTSEAEVRGPFEVVCIIDSRAASDAIADKTVAGAVNQVRASACQCGADGIIIGAVSNEGTTVFGWGSGTAIVKGIRYQQVSN